MLWNYAKRSLTQTRLVADPCAQRRAAQKVFHIVFHTPCGKTRHCGKLCGKFLGFSTGLVENPVENVENFCGKRVEIPLYVENVENFSPKIVENFIIVENSVESVEKFSTPPVEKSVDCGKLSRVFHRSCGKNCGKLSLIVESFVEKGFPQFLWKTLWKTQIHPFAFIFFSRVGSPAQLVSFNAFQSLSARDFSASSLPASFLLSISSLSVFHS